MQSNLVSVFDIDDFFALRYRAGDADSERYFDFFVFGSLYRVLEDGVLRDVEQFRDEIAIVEGPLGEEEATAVGMSQEPDVHEDFVAEDVYVELVRDVAYQLHEELALVEPVQLLSAAGPSQRLSSKIRKKIIKKD